MNNWQEEFACSYNDTEALSHFLDKPINKTDFPVFIPRALACKIKELGPESALWKQFIPKELEDASYVQKDGLYDPIGDGVKKATKQIIHRYQNRVLFLPTSNCPVTCRFCFRKNEIANNDKIFSSEFNETLYYLNNAKEVNEIIFSGGDSFILSDKKLYSYLLAFSKIPHIKFIRFHTKTVTTLPSRITPKFVNILKDASKLFKRVNIVLHINHIEELYQESRSAIGNLQETGIELLSQTVLLNGINDDKGTLFDLFEQLNNLNIRPYYLHHPDKVKGAMHFYLPESRGQQIYKDLRRLLPGWALPQYVIDSSDGSGKKAVL